MQLPTITEKGAPVSANTINRILEEMAASNLRGSGVGLIGKHSGGTVIRRKPRGLAPAVNLGRAFAHPFLVYDASSGGTPKVGVIFGQINSITPTIGGTALDNATPPELTVATGVVYLRAEVDGNGLVIAVIVANAAALPANTSTYGYITLATVTASGTEVTAISQSVTHSLGHQKCGTTTHNFWGV